MASHEPDMEPPPPLEPALPEPPFEAKAWPLGPAARRIQAKGKGRELDEDENTAVQALCAVMNFPAKASYRLGDYHTVSHPARIDLRAPPAQPPAHRPAFDAIPPPPPPSQHHKDFRSKGTNTGVYLDHAWLMRTDPEAALTEEALAAVPSALVLDWAIHAVEQQCAEFEYAARYQARYIDTDTPYPSYGNPGGMPLELEELPSTAPVSREIKLQLAADMFGTGMASRNYNILLLAGVKDSLEREVITATQAKHVSGGALLY